MNDRGFIAFTAVNCIFVIRIRHPLRSKMLKETFLVGRFVLRFHGLASEKDNLSCPFPVDIKRRSDCKAKQPFNSDYCKSKLLI